jgi:RNA recognition motif-containing protein
MDEHQAASTPRATNRSGMSKDLYVKNLSLQATEEDLRKLFSLMGKVAYVHLVKDAKSGQFVGAAYVKMSTEEEARAARIDLDGTRLIDRVIVVTEARDRTAPVGKSSDWSDPPPKKPFKGKRSGGSRGRS